MSQSCPGTIKKDLLSVVMVCRNHAAFLKESLDSVRAQTYPYWELIVVDDGSGDDSLQIIRHYQDLLPGRIRLLVHPQNENRGISASYTLGLSQCQGEFIGFLEGDDVWGADNARQKIEALKTTQAGLVYSAVKPAGDPGLIRKRSRYLRRCLNLPRLKPFRAMPRLLIFNFIPTFSTVIFRHSLLQDKPELLSERLYQVWLDWFLWAQLACRQDFYFIPAALVSWRMHAQSYATQTVCASGRIGELVFQSRYRLFMLRKLAARFLARPQNI